VPEPIKTDWHWGCLLCGETGPADTPAHALAVERSHRHFACPKAPGLDPAERHRREVWARVRRERYEEGVHPDTARWADPDAEIIRPVAQPVPKEK
jgi:hypothetical protein